MRYPIAALALLAAPVLLAACGNAPRAASPPETARARPAQATLADTVARVRSGVLRLETNLCDGEGQGTGFLLSPRLIATVQHVVDGASAITVKRNGEILSSATVIGSDADADIALLRTDAPLAGFNFKLADRRPRLAEDVAAIGFPLGLPLSVDRGSISGSDRTVTIGGIKRTRLIQTDAALNPGNSGGPLISIADARVVGLVDLKKVAASGVGFAVSADVARPLIDAWSLAPQPEPAADCALPTGESSTTEEIPPSTPPEDGGEERVRAEIQSLLLDFHEAIVDREYAAAWDLLTPRKQQQTLREHGYADWVTAQQSLTPYLDPYGIHVDVVSRDEAEQVALVMVSGMTWSKPGASCREWSGYTWVKYEDGAWRYDPGYSTTPARRAAWADRYAELLGASC
jgi:hypothetical protein